MDLNAQFCFRREAPAFTRKQEEHIAKLTRCSSLTLWEIISYGKLDAPDRSPLRKPVFLFGDSILADDSTLHDGNYKWLRQIGDRFIFIPNMVRMVPLFYLQSMSVPRLMDWDLTRSQGRISVGRVINYRSSPAGNGQCIVGLHPGLVGHELPQGETPKEADMFINRFMAAGGEFPSAEFRAPGWLHSTPQT